MERNKDCLSVYSVAYSEQRARHAEASVSDMDCCSSRQEQPGLLEEIEFAPSGSGRITDS